MHLLPNSLTPVLVQASYEMGAAILTAAETRNYMAEASWAATAPAGAILLTVLV
jgi:peptide/nickel transport system permease protein